jgi:hypothetical protein
MAVEDLQIWADHLETIRLPEIEADIADIQPRLSQAEADIVSKVQTINDTLTLHSARIDEAQVDADAAMDRANYALTRVYDQFIEANSNWMLALDSLRDELTINLNNSNAALTDAYTDAILAQLSAATLQVQAQFDVKVAEVEGIKSIIDGVKSDIDIDIDTLNNTILPGMNAEIDQLQLDTGTIAGDLTTLQSDLQAFYYSATDTETAISGAITTAKSEIENPDGTSLGATLNQSYRTAVDQDAATAASLLGLQTDIENPNGTSLGATLNNDYLTTTDTNSAISAAITTLRSEIEDPSGSSVGATLDQNYLTSAETNSAIASADATLKSNIESPTGTIRSILTTQYLTSADTDAAIAGAISTLKSEIEDENGTSLGATLSQNYYTSASTDAAIAAEISTVQASINGVSSDVTAVSNALADVEGNLAASYTLRVSAGGASAGFEIVAADNPGGPASTIRMDADNILIDGTVTADHIDSRGLSIRDANGNIILAAGSPLQVDNVSGLGNLATQNNVSTSQVTGLGSLATQDTVGWTSVTGRPTSLADLDAAAATQLDNKSVTYYQTSAPSTSIADTGDIWFDTNDNYKMYSFNGSSWQLVQDSAAASAAASAAQNDANTAQATADGKITTFYDSSEPTVGVGEGDLWYNSKEKVLRRYDGIEWLDISRKANVGPVSGPTDPTTTFVKDDIISLGSEDEIILHSTTDTSIAMSFSAQPVNLVPNEKFKVAFEYKSVDPVQEAAELPTSNSSGLIAEIAEYDLPVGETALPNGKFYISNNANHPKIQEDTRTIVVSSVNNIGSTNEWKRVVFEYSPTDTVNDTANFASLVIKNWTGLGTDRLHIRNVEFRSFVDDTAQLVDNAGLGSTAVWSNVTGSGRPADNADVTAQNTAAGILGQGNFATLDQITQSSASTYIADGAIDTAQINNAAITNAKIKDIIQSDNYVAGLSGWIINKSGSAEFINLIVRNSLQVGSVSDNTIMTAYSNPAVVGNNVYFATTPDFGATTADKLFNVGLYGKVRRPQNNSSSGITTLNIMFRTKIGSTWGSWSFVSGNIFNGIQSGSGNNLWSEYGNVSQHICNADGLQFGVKSYLTAIGGATQTNVEDVTLTVTIVRR